jgi:SAM-dependent methyltransferase
MFFPERVISFKQSDKVLEIGPGSTPHPRSDVYLELAYESKEAEQAQFGHTGAFTPQKPIVFYDGGRFPFQDREFDYVICSHVLEHVPDVEFFVSELQRVAPAGYLEFPTAYYDYLFNFDVHLNFLYWDGAQILWTKKSDFPLGEFSPLQTTFREALEKQSLSIVNELREIFIQGFEWQHPLVLKHTSSFDKLAKINVPIKDKRKKPIVLPPSFRQKVKIKLKLIIDRYL